MKMFHVDAFTKELFKGNPAGVCILGNENPPDEILLAIASELKHSETAFVLPSEHGTALRWFTPATEVDLCGHATLATAHILWEKGFFSDTREIVFQTKSGELRANKVKDKIELDFPLLFVDECPADPIINEAFGIEPLYTGKNEKRYLVEIADADKLRRLSPDFELLKKTDPGAFMITCKSDEKEFDFLSRFFAPSVGIPEDPVTGSAHCYLAPYWAEKLDKKELIGFQASKRTGILECRLIEDRVKLKGNAVTFFETEIAI